MISGAGPMAEAQGSLRRQLLMWVYAKVERAGSDVRQHAPRRQRRFGRAPRRWLFSRHFAALAVGFFYRCICCSGSSSSKEEKEGPSKVCPQEQQGEGTRPPLTITSAGDPTPRFASSLEEPTWLSIQPARSSPPTPGDTATHQLASSTQGAPQQGPAVTTNRWCWWCGGVRGARVHEEAVSAATKK